MTIATDHGIPERYYGNTEQRETERIRESFPEEVPFNYLILEAQFTNACTGGVRMARPNGADQGWTGWWERL